MTESSRLQWSLEVEVPEGWRAAVEELNAGFFHTPLWPRFGDEENEVYVWGRDDDGAVCMAVGAPHSCRLALRRRHFMFPSLPVVRSDYEPSRVLQELVQVLHARGAAEARFEADDARWRPDMSLPPPRWTERLEYVVDLQGEDAPDLSSFQSSHRKRVRDGQDATWSFRRLHGESAREAVFRVQKLAAERAAEKGDGFTPEKPTAVEDGDRRLDEVWGLATFAGFDHKQLLAVAMVGWGDGSAYYLRGGSTEEGYAEHAQQWLQWRIMEGLADSGFDSYNLGGTPLSAVDPDHPQNGLYRFKKRFGARLRATRGCWWRSLAPVHYSLHLAGRVMADLL